MRCYGGVMGCYEQPAITAITPVMAAPITLSGVNLQPLRTYRTVSQGEERARNRRPERAHAHGKKDRGAGKREEFFLSV